MINRRDVLHLGASAAASVLVSNEARPDDDHPAPLRVVDTNVSLFQWPFRRLPLDEPGKLVAKLRSLGIAQAWAGSFEGLLHRDIAGVNRRLVETCEGFTELIAIGSVNVQLPNWVDDLQRCIEVHDMLGVRLHPNYHGYELNDPRFAELLKRATSAGRFVQLAAAMEDTRTQHPMLQVPDVDLAPLPDVMSGIAGARVQLLNYRLAGSPFESLAKTPGLYFDTARVEATDGVPNLVKRLPPGRVLFGSHAPFLIPEAALIRVHESGQLDEAALREVLSQNAERVLENIT